MTFREYRDHVRSDLVRDIAVCSDAIAADDDCVHAAFLHDVTTHVVSDERDRDVVLHQLPGGEASTLKIWTSLIGDHRNMFALIDCTSDHTERGVRAALGIVERLASLNKALQNDAVPSLQIGIGIHVGEVVAGLIGPDSRVEYGVVGEPVNLAARIEGLTKDLTAIILVSRSIAARLGPEFVLGQTALLPVKGKSQPVEVVEVLARTPVHTAA